MKDIEIFFKEVITFRECLNKKRGMVKGGFLDKRAHNSVTCSPILMNFCMVGSFLVYLKGI